MNKNEHLPTIYYDYLVFYIDHTQVIAGYPQMAFRNVIKPSVEEVVKFMKSIGVAEDNIQSIDRKE